MRGIFGVIAAGVAQGMQNQQQQSYQGQRQFTVDNDAAERKTFRAEIQRRLNLMGYDAGYPDGSFGARTRQAIANFQNRIGHRPTGKISEAEVAVLYQNTNSLVAAGGGAGPAAAPAPNYAAANGSVVSNGVPPAAQAFVEPSLPNAQGKVVPQQGAAAYSEPDLPNVQPAAANAGNPLLVVSNQGPQAYQEPDTPQVSAGAQSKPKVETVATTNAALLETVKDAVCTEDNNKFASVTSFIDAGVLDKALAISKVDQAIRHCAETGGTARSYLLKLAGNEITIPIWISSPGYEHATKNDAWWGHFWLPHGNFNRILITGNYSQLLMMIDGPGTYYQSNGAFAEQVRANPNKRDCLGMPPMYYAAMEANFSYLKWLLDLGANPNIAVPFVVNGAGVVGEAVDGTEPITDSRQKGYGLISQYGCVDNGPSAALMGSYQSHNELVPVWALALERIRAGNIQDFQIATAMLAKVPSVPPSTIVDIMDDNHWSIRINQDEDLAMVKLLVSMGADINASRRNGTKPMAAFIQQGIKKQNLEQLLAVGARI